MSKYRKFGRLLMVARMARGLSRGQVAARVGLREGSLARVERGERLLSLVRFAQLHGVLAFAASGALDALGVSVVAVASKRRKGAGLQVSKPGPFATLGRAVARARLAAGLTQMELGRALGCARQYMARIEAGRALPSLVRFAQLWLVLRLDVDGLLALLRDGADTQTPFAGFGRVLVAARRARSMSGLQVATAARCELPLYHQVERGERLPTMRAAVRIHEVTRFDADAAMRSVWESGALDRMS